MTAPSSWAQWSRSVFLRDFAILGSGAVVAQAGALALLPILTRLYDPRAFGEFATIQSVALLLSICASARLDILIPIVKKTSDALTILKFILANTLLVSALFVIASTIYVLVVSDSGQWHTNALFCLMVLVMFFLLPISAALRYFAIRKRAFARIAQSQVSRVISSNGASIVGSFSGLFKASHAGGLIVGHVLGELVFCLVSHRVLTTRMFRYIWRVSWSKIRSVLIANKKMCITLCSTQFLQIIYGRLPIIVIASVYDLGLAGLYAVSERLALAPVSLISGSAGDVYRQRAASDYNAGRSFRRLFLKILSGMAAASIIPMSVAVYLAIEFSGVLLGEQWADAGSVLAIMLVTSYFVLIQNPLDGSSVVVGAHWYVFIWHCYRLLTIAAASAAAYYGIVDFQAYIVLLACLRISAALIDLVAGYIFSNRLAK